MSMVKTKFLLNHVQKRSSKKIKLLVFFFRVKCLDLENFFKFDSTIVITKRGIKMHFVYYMMGE
ncbi:hypothetical protein BpHYR1_028441 [Brachionus plicatilis]|uniref:Uncharacterized protein n=1 Tax=Brachionus plicatilis TaxID=10195 RepID=A0A3M7R2R2_BRAPC|nr:hypothetical protein BpHYR1_028441 [Brachionus plicatilis]